MIKHLYPSTIIALALIVLGLCLKSGIDNYAGKDRRVTVKGLSETEVKADHVTWPIQTTEVGNSLPALYDKIAQTRQTVTKFLTDNGIKESDISIVAPEVTDMNANQYSSNRSEYRYIISSGLTVSTSDVETVRNLVNRVGELLKEGIAVTTGTYNTRITYEYMSFADMKPKMMAEAIANAQTTAEQFAENSHSRLNKIVSADQGQFSISDRDDNTPYIKRVRVVTTITYSLKD
ncbi:MAG: SIMPL domain-containing protein [Duncaniella sp.]|nr:SIMPL domain-containing protein [Duncaniella sp.]